MSTKSLAAEEELMTTKATGPASVVQKLSGLQGDTSTSDSLIVCGDQQWPVHRAVLGLHSDVLYNASKGGFKEGTERKIDLSEDPPTCIEALIRYLYTLEYQTEDEDTLAFHVRICILADKYDIAQMKTLAVAHFKVLVSQSFGTADFAAAAAEAYEAPRATEEITDVILQAAVEHKLLLPVNGKESDLSVVARACPDLAVDLMARIPKEAECGKPGWVFWWCPHCNHQFYRPEYHTWSGDKRAYCFACGHSSNTRSWRVGSGR